MSFVPEVQISCLSHYVYCPKSAYIAYVLNDFAENEFTIQGKSIHTRVDSGVITKRREVLQIRSVWLKSEKYGLIGKADMIEEKDGKIYPVEYKRGKSNKWLNDHCQLTAQALCLEEMLNMEEHINKAYIFYHLSNLREEVEITPDLREFTIKTINEIREMLITGNRPEVGFTTRCPDCSVFSSCLPKETEKLKTIINKSSTTDYTD